MIKCPKDDKHEVVENQALNKKFYYCRACKEEVKEVQSPGNGISIIDHEGWKKEFEGLEAWLPKGRSKLSGSSYRYYYRTDSKGQVYASTDGNNWTPI